MRAVLRVGSVLYFASLLFTAVNADALPQTSTDIRFVTTPERLQRAIVDGVRHIVVGDHLAVNELEADPEGLAATMDNAIGDLLPSTRSIVVRCVSYQNVLQMLPSRTRCLSPSYNFAACSRHMETQLAIVGTEIANRST